MKFFMKVNNLFFIFHIFIFSSCYLSPAVSEDSDVEVVGNGARGNPCLATTVLEGEKGCIVRGTEYSETIYPHVTGCYCFFYTNPVLFRENITHMNYARCRQRIAGNNTLDFPCIILLPEYKFVPFDYEDPEAVKAIRGALVSTDATNKWIQCSKSAIDCCNKMDDSTIHPGAGYCPATWDAWTCWDKAPTGTVQYNPCADHVYVGALPSCQQFSEKECFRNGTWNQQTQYAPCSSNPLTLMKSRQTYHVIILGISVGLALPALVIFFSYRKLRITRVTLHRNLVLSIVVRNVFIIATKTAIVIDALNHAAGNQVMARNPEWCRVLSFLEKLSGSAVYSCMLLEGIFLHRLIAAAFKGEPNMRYYYLAVTGLACIPVLVWTGLTAVNNNINCWAVDISGYMYIVDGPRIAALAINALLMLDIVRVLCTKLRRINTAKSVQIRRMTRATILLLPLFGVQFLFTLSRPNTNDCDLEQVYYYFFYTMDGLQGAIVALLYCYLNKEVQMQLLKTYNEMMTKLYNSMGKDFTPKHRPTWQYSEHRQTATSLVMPDEIARSSVSFPKSSTFSSNIDSLSPPIDFGSKNDIPTHPRTSVSFNRTPIIFGNVSDILSQKEGPLSPGAKQPRSSKSYPRSSLKRDSLDVIFASKHLQVVEGPRQRKVSDVNEEVQTEDSNTEGQTQNTEVTSKTRNKAHDSDEEIVNLSSNELQNKINTSKNPFARDMLGQELDGEKAIHENDNDSEVEIVYVGSPNAQPKTETDYSKNPFFQEFLIDKYGDLSKAENNSNLSTEDIVENERPAGDLHAKDDTSKYPSVEDLNDNEISSPKKSKIKFDERLQETERSNTDVQNQDKGHDSEKRRSTEMMMPRKNDLNSWEETKEVQRPEWDLEHSDDPRDNPEDSVKRFSQVNLGFTLSSEDISDKQIKDKVRRRTNSSSMSGDETNA